MSIRHPARPIAAVTAFLMMLVGIMLWSHPARAQVYAPSQPSVTISADQAGGVGTRQVDIAEDSSDVPIFGVETLYYGLTIDATATEPNGDYPGGSTTSGKVTLDVSGFDNTIDVYVEARAQGLDSGGNPISSKWTKPLLVSGPDYTGATPAPSPSPDPAPTSTPTPTPMPTPTAVCPSTEFIGVRGSGETEADAGGFGKTVAAVRDDVTRLIPGLHSEHVNYEALKLGVGGLQYGFKYDHSVQDGMDKLDPMLLKVLTDCTNTLVILVGYSQGAQVAGNVFVMLPAGLRARVILVMLGDPRFNPKQPQVDAGDYDKRYSGIYISQPKRQIPAADIPNVHSYCTKGDPVCNFTGVDFALCLAHPLPVLTSTT